MKKWRVWKDISLVVDIEAATEEEAIDQMLDMDDNTFEVTICDYGAEENEE